MSQIIPPRTEKKTNAELLCKSQWVFTVCEEAEEKIKAHSYM